MNKLSLRGEAAGRGRLRLWTKDQQCGESTTGGIPLSLLSVLPFVPGIFAPDLEREVETRRELLQVRDSFAFDLKWPYLRGENHGRMLVSQTSQTTSHELQHRPWESLKSLAGVWKVHQSGLQFCTPQGEGFPSSRGKESQRPGVWAGGECLLSSDITGRARHLLSGYMSHPSSGLWWPWKYSTHAAFSKASRAPKYPQGGTTQSL